MRLQTMLCFTCKSEYPRGVTRCARCGTPLVYRFPANPSPKTIDVETNLVVVRVFNNTFDANVARMTLSAAGIDSLILSDDYAGGALPHLSFIKGVQILVRSEDVEDADEILRVDASGSL